MKYFFIGIKGSGMSALACILKDLGNEVSGSDVDKHFFTQKNLEDREIKMVAFGEEDFANIDIVILGNSFNDTNIDFINAKNKNIKIVKYFEALNELVINKNSVAVAGANGKTTTTGLMVKAMEDQNPTYLIGDGTGVGAQETEDFIFEACEYKNTFYNYSPTISVINNIVFDHPDFFKDIDDMINSFQTFANKAQILVINGDDENCQKINHQNKFTFGLNTTNDLYAENVSYEKEGVKFSLVYNKENIGQFILPFFGEYMLLNSLGVILTNLLLKRDIDLIINNLKKFKGTNRRFSETILSEQKELFLIDDYAHHPTAIKETLKALRQKYPTLEIISIFQPHTFSREKVFAKDFALELSKSDKIILADVFRAQREQEIEEHESLIKKELQKLNVENKIIQIEDLTEELNNSVICLFGAGDIDLLYKDKLIEQFKEK